MTSPREPFTCLYRGIWNDEKFWLRSELGQRVYLYILSTPMGNGLGCFRAGMAAMAEDLRMSPARFVEGFAEGSDERLGEPLFLYDENARVVFIPKYLERNPPSNPNGIRALSKPFISIPECRLKYDCYQTVKAFVEGKKNESTGKGETFIEAFNRTFVEPLLNHVANLGQTILATFAEPPGIARVPFPCPIPVPIPVPVPVPLQEAKERDQDQDLELDRPVADRSTAPADFDLFWAAYPRKTAKTKALAAWKKTKKARPPIEEILVAVALQKRSPQWLEEGGKFIPHPTTWLNGGQWDDVVEQQEERPAETRTQKAQRQTIEWIDKRLGEIQDEKRGSGFEGVENVCGGVSELQDGGESIAIMGDDVGRD